MVEPHTLEREVAETCRTEELLCPEERVLVAVSGGADSTALALLLGALGDHELPLHLVLAHLDHGWRGLAEAAADRAAVESVAALVGAELVVAGPPDPAAPTEERARRWRYRRLDWMAREHGCPKVATGHHLGDQAETVWMRLKRGSGPVGLRGIPRRRPLGEHGVEVVRPLLDVDPQRLRAWLAGRGVAWREDPTNRDLSRDRARARAEIARLEGRGEPTKTDLRDLAKRLGRRLENDEAHLADRIDGLLVRHPMADAVEVPRDALRRLPSGLLDLAVRRLGREIRAERQGPWFTRRHLRGIGALLESGGALDLPRGLRFEVSGRRAWLRRWRSRPAPKIPALGYETVDAQAFDLGAFLAARRPGRAALDAERLGPAPRLRLARPGDCFVPWGREPERSVDVFAWLTRRQVPAWLRERQLVAEGENGVAWICGLRVDRTHAVRPDTRTVAVLEFE